MGMRSLEHLFPAFYVKHHRRMLKRRTEVYRDVLGCDNYEADWISLNQVLVTELATVVILFPCCVNPSYSGSLTLNGILIWCFTIYVLAYVILFLMVIAFMRERGRTQVLWQLLFDRSLRRRCRRARKK